MFDQKIYSNYTAVDNFSLAMRKEVKFENYRTPFQNWTMLRGSYYNLNVCQVLMCQNYETCGGDTFPASFVVGYKVTDVVSKVCDDCLGYECAFEHWKAAHLHDSFDCLKLDD